MRWGRNVREFTKAIWHKNSRGIKKAELPTPVLILLGLANTKKTPAYDQGHSFRGQLVETDCIQTSK